MDTQTHGEPLVHVSALVRPDQFDAIEEIVTRTGTDRSAVIRRVLDLGLAQLDEIDGGTPS